MKRQNMTTDLSLEHLDDDTVEEIAEQYPVLDEAMKHRIEQLCMEKLSMEQNEQNMITEETSVQTIRRPIWRRFGAAIAACLVIAAGVTGIAMLQNGRNSIEPGTETNDTSDICEETQRYELLSEEAILMEMETLFERHLLCGVIHWCDQLESVGNPLNKEKGIFEVSPSPFADYAAYESYILETYTTEAANDLFENAQHHPYQYFASDDGKLCTQLIDWDFLERLHDLGAWDDFAVTVHSYDETSCRFSASPTSYTDEELAEGITYSISCTAVLEEEGWRLTELYHPDCIETAYRQPEDPSDRSEGVSDLDSEVSTSMEAEMRALFDQNLICIENIFVESNLSTIGDPMDGDHLHQVNPELFADYNDFSDFVKSVYCDDAAELYLTTSEYGIGIDAPYPEQPLYVEYDGKLCIDFNNRINAYSYPFSWTEYELEILYADETTCVFEVMTLVEPLYDGYTKEESLRTCTALFEDGQWVLEYMYY